MSLIGTILTSGTVGVVLVALLGLLGNLRTLRANKPVAEASADEKQALTNRTNIGVMQDVINSLQVQLDRQSAAMTSLESKVETLEAKLAEAERSEDLLHEQLTEAQTSTRQERISARSAKARADEAAQEVIELRKRVAALEELLRQHGLGVPPLQPLTD